MKFRASNPDRWQLVSDNAVWMFPAQIQLSTVELGLGGIAGDRFESCLFWADGESDVVARYATREQAYQGHRDLEDQHGLTRRINPWNHYLWD